MSDIIWTTKNINIDDIKPATYNPRKINKEQADNLSKSISKFNIADPLIINLDNTLIGGHQRYKILKKNKVSEVDVRVPSRLLDKNEEKELNLRLNKNLGEWDLDTLAEFDEEMLFDVGFNSDDLKDVFEIQEENIEKDNNIPDKLEETRTRPGDIWKLGKHRLICGDSTNVSDVERLIGNNKCDLMFTDPPYGVSYSKKNEFLNKLDEGNRVQKEIENDSKSIDEIKVLWKDCFSLVATQVLKDVSSYYVCSPQGGDLLQMMMMMMKEGGLSLKHMIIWKKNNHVLGRCDYNYKHEPILFGWHKKHKFYGYGDQKFSVWDYNKPLKNDLHPTMKPVELVVNAILNSTERNMKVYDPFLGSGTTLIACEKTNRSCYGFEIDPDYCDVIVRRWEEYTGNKAELLSE